METRLYTTAQAAAELGIKVITVRKHIERGRLAAKRYGRDLWITQDALDAFKASRRGRGKPKHAATEPPTEQTV